MSIAKKDIWLDVKKIFIGNDLKSISQIYQYYDGKSNVVGKCPQHETSVCTFEFVNFQVIVHNCSSCLKDNVRVIIEKKKDKKSNFSFDKKLDLIEVVDCMKEFIETDNYIVFQYQKNQQLSFAEKVYGKVRDGIQEVRMVSKTDFVTAFRSWMLEEKFEVYGKNIFGPGTNQKNLDEALEKCRVFLHNKNLDITYVQEERKNSSSSDIEYTFKLIEPVVPGNTIIKMNQIGWPAFLERLSDKEAFCAYIWSLYEQKNRGRQLLYFYGRDGQEGKSLFTEMLSHKFGKDYTAILNGSSFSDNNKFDLASAVGKRVGIVPDSNISNFVQYSSVKKITGGDSIKIEEKFKNPIDVKLDIKLIVTSNMEPTLDDTSSQTSRILFIRIVRPKPGEKIQKEIMETDKEWNLFLQYCKYCYKIRCPDNYNIISNKSESDVDDFAKSKNEYLIDTLRDHFDFDKDKTSDWFISSKVFRDKLKLIDKKYDNNHAFKEVKDAMINYGLKSFEGNNGVRKSVNGNLERHYAGIRLKTYDTDELDNVIALKK
jgi:hypothetical protein